MVMGVNVHCVAHVLGVNFAIAIAVRGNRLNTESKGLNMKFRIRFESPIIFTRVDDGWTMIGETRMKQEGYRAVIFRLPRISFYWSQYDSDF